MFCPQSIFPTYVIKGLGWTVKHGALLASGLQASNVIGRLVGVPVSGLLNPETNLGMNICISLVGYILLVFTPNLPAIWMWLATVLIGLGNSSNYGTMFLWTNLHIPVTGRVASVGVIGLSVGQMISAATTGTLFQNHGTTVFVSIFLSFSLAHLGLYLISITYTKCVKFSYMNVNQDEKDENTL